MVIYEVRGDFENFCIKNTTVSERFRIPKKAIWQVWLQNQILILLGNWEHAVSTFLTSVTLLKL